ncbi:hypothetical protein G5I_14795 [Acromyrmex echinatior]|uniref:Uncharacterized protein n=1 Tax=Acromyrmex echinatior TaxID=103372 RepID=F4X8Q5_ACREC|nr:hypothetical protein G5I_14795 [Acromyrmex echinatior]
MENTFDIETLATISSGKKERVDGEPSISNRLEVCFVAIASSEKPLLRDGSLAYEASSVNNYNFSVSFEELNNVCNVINDYFKIYGIDGTGCSRYEFVSFSNVFRNASVGTRNLDVSKLLIRRSVYMLTQGRRAIIRTSKLKQAEGNLIRRGSSDLGWTIVVRFVNRQAGTTKEELGLAWPRDRGLYADALGDAESVMVEADERREEHEEWREVSKGGKG